MSKSHHRVTHSSDAVLARSQNGVELEFRPCIQSQKSSCRSAHAQIPLKLDSKCTASDSEEGVHLPSKKNSYLKLTAISRNKLLSGCWRTVPDGQFLPERMQADHEVAPAVRRHGIEERKAAMRIEQPQRGMLCDLENPCPAQHDFDDGAVMLCELPPAHWLGTSLLSFCLASLPGA